MFDVPLDEMTSDIRRQAEPLTLGSFTVFRVGLAQPTYPTCRSTRVHDQYFERPGIKEYMDQTVAFAKEHNRVETYSVVSFIP